MSGHILTVGRQFGSGGAEIAKRVAELMKIPYVDKETLMKAAEDSGICRDAFEKADERATSSFLYSIAMSTYNGHMMPVGTNELVMSDKLYIVQANEIKRIAAQGDCVIVGRCADDVLNGFENLTKVFIHAPIEYRIERIMQRYSLPENSAKTLIKKTDKKRASYYSFYTNNIWGEALNYNLSIDSSVLGTEKTAEFIRDFLLKRD